MGEMRKVVYDEQLKIEAYQFQGIMQRFPNHFHEHYVIGFIERGKRHLYCRNREYNMEPGHLMLFEPEMNHACEQVGEEALDYRCLNIPKDVMLATMQEITQRFDVELPRFEEAVIFHAEQIESLRNLHQLIMDEEQGLEKEELYYFLMQELIAHYAVPISVSKEENDSRIEEMCEYMRAHYAENISLEQLRQQIGMNKFVMLRSFAAQKGITPFQYLMATRINVAMQLLEEGKEPLDVALQTGFTDQSHFSNTFKRTIGLTPGQYKMIRNGKK